jgi:hypothetical protein
MVMVVKQPAVKAGVEESSLNCSKIHAADCTADGWAIGFLGMEPVGNSR